MAAGTNPRVLPGHKLSSEHHLQLPTPHLGLCKAEDAPLAPGFWLSIASDPPGCSASAPCLYPSLGFRVSSSSSHQSCSFPHIPAFSHMENTEVWATGKRMDPWQEITTIRCLAGDSRARSWLFEAFSDCRSWAKPHPVSVLTFFFYSCNDGCEVFLYLMFLTDKH